MGTNQFVVLDRKKNKKKIHTRVTRSTVAGKKIDHIQSTVKENGKLASG